MSDTSKVRQRQAYAMGSKPGVGSAGGNPYKAGKAAQGSAKQGGSKTPGTTHTFAKLKGSK